MTDEEMAAYGRRHDGVSNAMNDIWRERIRQMEAEGWMPEHDDAHGDGEMAHAAAAYAIFAGGSDGFRDACNGKPPAIWPWGHEWWKPKDRRRELVKAAALIVAEIERLDRAAQPSPLQPKE